MKVFWIGQRVRIVGAYFHPEVIGKEATITSPACDYEGWGHWAIVIDDASHEEMHFDMHHMEPVVPPDIESLEEINALYEPSPEVVTVEKRA